MTDFIPMNMYSLTSIRRMLEKQLSLRVLDCELLQKEKHANAHELALQNLVCGFTQMEIGMVNDKRYLNGMRLGFDARIAAENYVVPGEVARESKKTDCFSNTISNQEQ